MKIEATPLAIPGVMLIKPGRAGDSRGWFSEVFNQAELAKHGVEFSPIQENLAFNAEPGVVRGLHAQTPPAAQAKLVRAARGRIFDVAVDARRGSSTFGKWVGAELTAEGGEQLFVPAGCLHGYATREPGCEVAYLIDAPYAPETEIQIRWDDPAIGIDWGVAAGAASLSGKDAAAPLWADFDTPFAFA